MVEQLRQVVGPDLLARMQELKMTMHEVLTLASVIEKETGSGDERPEISAVFHNRLKKHIPLQSDPTVIYGLPAFDGNLHKKDLSSPSPYNTYRVQGLPPGPIANPGIQAIRATLYPSNSQLFVFCLTERRNAPVLCDADRAQQGGGEISEAALSSRAPFPDVNRSQGRGLLSTKKECRE